jgi:hypothetical protein
VDEPGVGELLDVMGHRRSAELEPAEQPRGSSRDGPARSSLLRRAGSGTASGGSG